MVWLWVSMLGSPPRMRGKAPAGVAASVETGITPAYAGKRASAQIFRNLDWDHPRVCGEKKHISTKFRKHTGSPPRMRGKALFYRFALGLLGITPAYAGKSSLACCPWRLHWDHPRVCGEKARPRLGSRRHLGSPPRMRGKVEIHCCRVFDVGITPAYAGKSSSSIRVVQSSRDHPRVCGEKTKKIPSHRPFQLHPVPVSFSFA